MQAEKKVTVKFITPAMSSGVKLELGLDPSSATGKDVRSLLLAGYLLSYLAGESITELFVSKFTFAGGKPLAPSNSDWLKANAEHGMP